MLLPVSQPMIMPPRSRSATLVLSKLPPLQILPVIPDKPVDAETSAAHEKATLSLVGFVSTS